MRGISPNPKHPPYLVVFCVLVVVPWCACSLNADGRTFLTVFGFSITKEVMERDIFPGFARQWRGRTGQELVFSSSFAGSETITNQILAGVPADVAVLAISRDFDRLVKGGAVAPNWRVHPHQGIINRTPFVILVRKGNPHHITDFADLARTGVRVLHPDPFTSGGAQWSILGLYGSALIHSEEETGKRDPVRGLALLTGIWRNVIGTPGSAREARTQFETGFGDALVTYEQEWLQMQKKGGPYEVVVPRATIFSEHPAAVIDRNVTTITRPIAEAFLSYLWSEEAQRAFVRAGFRSVIDTLNTQSVGFSRVERPISVEEFGGWEQAYPEIIEGVWKRRVSGYVAAD